MWIIQTCSWNFEAFGNRPDSDFSQWIRFTKLLGSLSWCYKRSVGFSLRLPEILIRKPKSPVIASSSGSKCSRYQCGYVPELLKTAWTPLILFTYSKWNRMRWTFVDRIGTNDPPCTTKNAETYSSVPSFATFEDNTHHVYKPYILGPLARNNKWPVTLTCAVEKHTLYRSENKHKRVRHKPKTWKHKQVDKRYFK